MKKIALTLLVFSLLLFGGSESALALTSLPTLDYTGTATSTESAGSVSLAFDSITTIDRAHYLNGDFTDVNNSEETIIDAVLSLTGLAAGDCSTAASGYVFFPAAATMAITGPDSFVYMTVDVSYLPPGSSVLFLFDGTRWLLYPPTLDASDPSLLNFSNIQTYTDATHPSRYIDELANALITASADIAGMTMILTPQPGSGTLCDGGTNSTYTVQGLIDGAPDVPLNIGPDAVAGVDGALNVDCAASSCDVLLVGSGSTDPDDGIEFYMWYDAGGLIGTGETLVWTLPLGVHDITLQVIDFSGVSDTDTITIVIDPAELSFIQIDKAHVKRDGKVKIRGRLSLPSGVSHLDIDSVGHAIIGISDLANNPVIDESVDFTESTDGNKWKYNVSPTLGIKKFRIDWTGSKYNYQDGGLTIQTDHIGDNETELVIISCLPYSITVGGVTITRDENGLVTASDPAIKVDGDDDGDSDDSDSDGGYCPEDDDCIASVRLPFALTPSMSIDVNGTLSSIGDGYTAAVGKFKIHGRFDVTGIDFSLLVPILDLTVTLGTEEFYGNLIIDEVTWTKIKPKYWKYRAR